MDANLSAHVLQVARIRKAELEIPSPSSACGSEYFLCVAVWMEALGLSHEAEEFLARAIKFDESYQ